MVAMKRNDFLKESDEMKSFEEKFILSPLHWNSFNVNINLEWNQIQFNKSNHPEIPEERGIYSFIIKHHTKSFPSHGYIMYIGKTDKLKRRFGDYIHEKNNIKRPKIYRLLNKWDNFIFFTYAIVRDRRYSLEKLEDALLNSIIPPCNEDFTFEISRKRKAFK
jgi:hypothetical protein